MEIVGDILSDIVMQFLHFRELLIETDEELVKVLEHVLTKE
jgi:hypothetical protein